jgi:hypothetical protein
MGSPFGARLRAAFVLFSSLVAVACTRGDDARLTCETALSHFEELRLVALKADPVLAGAPELAAEHARQTRAVFDSPVASRCASDPSVARCVAASATFDQAQQCL